MSKNHILKSTYQIGLALLVFTQISCSQTPSNQQVSNPSTPASADASYKAEHEGWLVDIEEAYALSKKTNRPILANFTGSDWCIWCKRLAAAVFVHDEFKKWAKENVILLELDFPRGKTIPAKIQQQNYNMQQVLQVQGFPTVWLFDLNKNETTNQFNIATLGQTGYTATASEFISKVNQFMSTRKK